jgi:hypothetical protein
MLLIGMGCGGDGQPDVAPEGDPLHLDQGSIGLLLDTRKIFKAGHQPATASISFPSAPDHDVSLEIDQLTNLAVLSIHSRDLSDAEREMFAQGLAASIVVTDSSSAELGQRDFPALFLDSSNAPIFIEPSVPPVAASLDLSADLPYLLQPEGEERVMELRAGCNDCYDPTPYAPGREGQQFYFTETESGSGVYTIENINPNFLGTSQVFMQGDYLGVRSSAEGGPEDFALEPDLDGFVQIRHLLTERYLVTGPNGDIRLSETDEATRFRIISDSIKWSVVDLGTRFNQPNMPPAQLDFAYSGRLSNCSSATLEESVGSAEERTSTVTISTTEGMELFSQSTTSATVTNSTTVAGGVGFEVFGIGASADVEHTMEDSFTEEFTTASTVSSESTWERSVSITTQVSRERTVSVPEHTIVDVDDAIKTIRNVSVPFTQVLRVKGSELGGEFPLSGEQLATQLRSNFVTALVTKIGEDYVEVSIRGTSVIDQMINASTLVQEVDPGCE